MGKHKASEAEHCIFLVKRKLYLILQSKQTNNWPKYIKDVVTQLNQVQVPKLGYVRPIEINSFLDDYKVRDGQNLHGISAVSAPTLSERRENEKKYSSAKNVLQLGDLVYLDPNENKFSKQYVRKVKHIFIYYL